MEENFLERKENGKELSSMNIQQLLRELECLIIVGRDKQPAPYLLPCNEKSGGRIPIYFRRAAINGAIMAGRSYLARSKHRNGEGLEQTRRFYNGITFYKGHTVTWGNRRA